MAVAVQQKMGHPRRGAPGAGRALSRALGPRLPLLPWKMAAGPLGRNTLEKKRLPHRPLQLRGVPRRAHDARTLLNRCGHDGQPPSPRRTLATGNGRSRMGSASDDSIAHGRILARLLQAPAVRESLIAPTTRPGGAGAPAGRAKKLAPGPQTTPRCSFTLPCGRTCWAAARGDGPTVSRGTRPAREVMYGPGPGFAAPRSD